MTWDYLKQQLQIKKELYLKVKVRPRAKKTAFIKILSDDTVKIDIAAPAEQGRANEELFNFLASEFLVLKHCIKILSGENDRFKLIRIIRLH
ncbi:MAG: DUF167 domain-containing protein [Planctomycetes bacterium]|jgi:hypothetical protein|nr:DUF167 domain-containing protein [Planctomycetota bacterium]